VPAQGWQPGELEPLQGALWAGEGEPTVDRIDVAAFASQEKLKEWVSQHAPAFLNGPLVAL
jgi:hypothetical protein